MTLKRRPTQSKYSELPSDYTSIVEGILSTTFADGLQALNKKNASPTGAKFRFYVGGRIYLDEILVYASLLREGDLAATTVHASSDFDPRANHPTAEDILALCIDGVGNLFQALFEKTKAQNHHDLTLPTLDSVPGVPLLWTQTELEKRSVFVLVDKSNPILDQQTEDWLSKNDPFERVSVRQEEQETENLFVLPPNSSPKRHS